MNDDNAPYPVRIALSPNGKYVATVQPLTTIIWDAATGKPLEDIKTKIGGPSFAFAQLGVAFLPDSTGVVWHRGGGGGDWSSELVHYDVAKRKELHRSMVPKGTGGYWERINVSPDGGTAALFGAKVSKNANNAEKIDYYVFFWSLSDGQMREVPVSFQPDHFDMFCFSPDWKRMIVDHTRYDVATGAKENTQNTVGGVAYAFSPDGTKLAMKTRGWRRNLPEGEIVVLDTATGKPLQALPNYKRFLALAPDNKTIALHNSTEPNVLTLLDVTTGKAIFHMLPSGIKFATFSPDGKFVAATVGNRAELHVWKATTAELVKVLTAGERQQLQPEFSPDSTMLACGGSPAKLWDTATWKDRFSNQISLGDGGTIFSPDSKLLAISGPNDVKLYDTKTGVKSADLTLGGGVWYRKAFIAKGKLLVDSQIVMDLATGKEVFRVATALGTALPHPDGKSFFTFLVFRPQLNDWRGIQQWSAENGKKLKEWPFDVR